MSSITNLVQLQREITSEVLSVCADRGFALAGGGALREHRFTARPTEDIDLFTNTLDAENFQAARDAVVERLQESGWKVAIGRSAETFATLIVEDDGGLKTEIDMGVDWRAHPAPVLEVGPVLHETDAVATKTLAVFGRGYMRDLLDLDAILSSKQYSIDDLMKLAAEYDPGFEPRYFHSSIIEGLSYEAKYAQAYGVSAQEWEGIKQRLALAGDEVVMYIAATSNPGGLSDEDVAIIDAIADRSMITDDWQADRPISEGADSRIDNKNRSSEWLTRGEENEL